SAGDKVLDLGCGYGVAGIPAARLIGQENVVMCDISESSVKQAKKNAELNGVPNTEIIISDGLRDVSESGFTLILSTPPYHADFSVPKRFIEDSFKKPAAGGKFVMVTKRLDWYKNKLISVFGGVRVWEINGYYVFISEKRGERKPKKEKTAGGLSKKLRRKQALLGRN
ncbi:MAG: class I SAM-dependent methyltransferase, partial [Ruminococcus sp.]|nr:class I SAM-dependent methyltransferase [Ruminococcus sp.]